MACRAYYQQQYDAATYLARRRRLGGRSVTFDIGDDDDGDYCDDGDDDDQDNSDDEDCDYEDIRFGSDKLAGHNRVNGISTVGSGSANCNDDDDDDDDENGVSPKEVKKKKKNKLIFH